VYTSHTGDHTNKKHIAFPQLQSLHNLQSVIPLAAFKSTPSMPYSENRMGSLISVFRRQKSKTGHVCPVFESYSCLTGSE
jgi:hypothetical protein